MAIVLVYMSYMMQSEPAIKQDHNDCYRFAGDPPQLTVIGTGFIGKARITHDWRGGEFWHLAMSIVLRGTGTYFNADRTAIPLEPGSVFLRVPGIDHANDIDPNSDWLEFFVSLSFADREVAHSSKDPELSLWDVFARRVMMVNVDHPVWSLEPDEVLLRRCNLLLEQVRAATDTALLPMKALEFMIWMLEKKALTSTDPLVDQAAAIIRDNFANRTPLPELMREIPLSYIRLRERFVNGMGKSMGQYQLDQRLERALSLLKNGLSVKEVADKLGYSDQFAFSKQFSKKMGYPPSRGRLP
jgi:AraC-like DNA-binding protein/quercetin dioxygenase-like cupin family protein